MLTAACSKSDQSAETAVAALPDSVSAWADALRDTAGFPNAEQAPAELPSMRRAQIDASTALADDGLRIEILKITDERTWKAFLGASMIMTGTQSRMFDVMQHDEPDGASDTLKQPKVYPAPPYVVVVREEPEDGMVERAFERIIGYEE
ncbi:MAG: hypothetical protein ACLFTT_08670 [Candidatus Hydrogenedentota bacterium]